MRWESGQQYATQVLLAQIERWQQGERRLEAPDGIIAAVAATLMAHCGDPAFAAEAMTLPSENFLADQMAVADPDAIHAVREAARAAIGMQLAPILQASYEQLTDAGPVPGRWRIDRPPRAAQHVPGLYRRGQQRLGAALAKSQFDTWQNMTDVLAALSVLCGIDCPQRTSALDNFYRAWHEDDLVLDKWFAIQAMSNLGTPEAVRALSHHADFDLRNPNRVRALVSSFAAGNPVHFHAASGAGYRFLADTIIELDPRNPQVAARMVAPLGQWRRVDAARQALMQQELRRILEVPGADPQYVRDGVEEPGAIASALSSVPAAVGRGGSAADRNVGCPTEGRFPRSEERGRSFSLVDHRHGAPTSAKTNMPCALPAMAVHASLTWLPPLAAYAASHPAPNQRAAHDQLPVPQPPIARSPPRRIARRHAGPGRGRHRPRGRRPPDQPAPRRNASTSAAAR